MRLLIASFVVAAALCGLGYWVLAVAPAEGGFRVSLDDTRELPQGGYYVGNYPAPASLNPFLAKDAVALSAVLRFTHDCLMQLDVETRELEPALAMVVRSAGLRHEFELRSDARFSDGTPVTVADVRFTFDACRDASLSARRLGDTVALIARFEVLDGRRFAITLRKPHFNGLAEMTTGYRVMSRAWFLRKIRAIAAKNHAPVPDGPGAAGFGAALAEVRLPGPATGPYQFATDDAGRPLWREGRTLWLVQNPHSWHRTAFPRRWNLAGIGLRFLGSAAAFTELKQQRLDWYLPMEGVQALLQEHPDLAEHYRTFRYDSPTLGLYYIGWNCDRLTDPRVRTALGMLFDRHAIVTDLLGGSAELADSWFRRTDPEHPRNPDPLPFDTQGAASLLRKAGYGDGHPLSVQILAARSERARRILDVAKGAFAAAGVKLEAKLMDLKAVMAQQFTATDRKFDGVLAYWRRSPLTIDPHDVFHSAGSQNFMHYRNEAVDALLTEARTTTDAGRRVRLYRRFGELVRADQPMALLVHPLNTLLLHKRFRDAEPTWQGAVPARWWVPEGERIHAPGRPR